MKVNKLTIQDDRLVFEQDNQKRWTLNINKIKFIGEYTTEAGPFTEDWFFVFADTMNEWWQAPTLAVDHKQFWKQLGQKLNCEMAPGLAASTNWTTRVIYPKSHEGQDMFLVVKTDVKQKTFWRKLFSSSADNEHLELTNNLKQLFK
jgi:hypothetical protein